MDSGGPGTFRGGLGQTMEIGVTTGEPYTFSLLFDRTHYPAAGYAGGKPGALAHIELDDGTIIDSKGAREFDADTRVSLGLPGGGGFYAPENRDPQSVADDVIDGLVSLQHARERYRVVIDPDTLEVDRAATDQLRGR
jgi:N-methylhydantoinase B